jgi:hypothetical protein
MDSAELQSVQQDSEAWDEVKAAFLRAQANQCAICRRGLSFDTAHLDHCHQTGFIRGVLCVSCNTKLGFYETRRAAIERYLATAAEFAAYIVPTRIPATQKPKVRDREWLRRYWQSKELD